MTGHDTTDGRVHNPADPHCELADGNAITSRDGFCVTCTLAAMDRNDEEEREFTAAGRIGLLLLVGFGLLVVGGMLGIIHYVSKLG